MLGCVPEPLQLAFGESVASAGERIMSEFKKVRGGAPSGLGAGVARPPASQLMLPCVACKEQHADLVPVASAYRTQPWYY